MKIGSLSNGIKCIWILLLMLLTPSLSIRCKDGAHWNSGSKCKCERVNGTPWSNKTDRPAPSVHVVKAKVFVDKYEKIGIKLRWSLKATYLQDLDGGFFVEVIRVDADLIYYICKVNVKQINTTKHFVTFHFIYGQGTIQLNNESFLFKISSLPMYTFDSRPYTKNDSVRIGCKNKALLNTTHCDERLRNKKICERLQNNKINEKYEKNSKSTEKPDQPIKQDPTIFIVLGVIIIILVALCFVTMLLMCISRHGTNSNSAKEPSSDKRRILIIGDTENERNISISNQLYKIIQSSGGNDVEIVLNARNMTTIGQEGVSSWMSKELTTSYICIFLIDKNKIKSDQANCVSHVSVAIGLAESIVLKQHYKDSRKKFIAVHFKNCSKHDTHQNLVFCEHYHIANDLKKLLKHVLGFNAKPQNYDTAKKMLFKLLSTGIPEHTNDINSTRVVECIEEEESLNIRSDDEFISIECNT